MQISSLTSRELARLLGGDPYRDGAVAPGPGHGPRDRSLRVWLERSAPDGFSVYSHAGDDWRDCRDHVREKLRLSPWQPGTAPSSAVRLAEQGDDEGRRRDIPRWLWDQSLSSSRIIMDYLAGWRGIPIQCLPATIRYLPPRPPKYVSPTMVAAFALAEEPEPGRLAVPRTAISAVHLTRLRPDGRGRVDDERAKTMHGRSLGTPIVLAPPNDNMGLAITEGIEDALSVHIATGLGAWAAGSAGHMPALADAVPDYIDMVTVVADDNETGQRNAALLAARLDARGIAAGVQTPGADMRAAA
jgi:Toprim domain